MKTIAFSSVRVPAPIFAAVLLAALVGAGIFAARAFDPRIENAATATNAAPTSAAPPQTIEKPIETVVEKSIEKVVVREKIVKQIVFVERKTASKSRNSFAARNVEPVAEPNDQINLAEFKPVAKAAPSVEKAAPENRK